MSVDFISLFFLPVLLQPRFMPTISGAAIFSPFDTESNPRRKMETLTVALFPGADRKNNNTKRNTRNAAAYLHCVMENHST